MGLLLLSLDLDHTFHLSHQRPLSSAYKMNGNVGRHHSKQSGTRTQAKERGSPVRSGSEWDSREDDDFVEA